MLGGAKAINDTVAAACFCATSTCGCECDLNASSRLRSISAICRWVEHAGLPKRRRSGAGNVQSVPRDITLTLAGAAAVRTPVPPQPCGILGGELAAGDAPMNVQSCQLRLLAAWPSPRASRTCNAKNLTRAAKAAWQMRDSRAEATSSCRTALHAPCADTNSSSGPEGRAGASDARR